MQPEPPREPHSINAVRRAPSADANDSAHPTAVLSPSWSAAYAAQRPNVRTTEHPDPHSRNAADWADDAVS